MKRIISLVLSLLMIASLLSGCAIRITVERAGSTASDIGADPLFWKVTGEDGATLYLFGTIHIGDERSDAVYAELEKYLDACDSLAVEVDLVEFRSDGETIDEYLDAMRYTDGTTIEDHVSRRLYVKMKDIVYTAGLSPDDYMYGNCAFWNQLITSIKTVETGYTPDHGMDVLLIGGAYERNMEVRSIESAEFQLDMLNDLSSDDSESLRFIVDTPVSSLKLSYKIMYSAWLTGDENFFEVTFSMQDPAIIGGLLDDRNPGMAEFAKGCLESGDSVFLAVGAGHMVGDTGIVQELADAGYKIERIHITDGVK